ncbi:MAG: class I SAM-dependent methyltransferase [Planctomycetes bacterium]|nr:class I SAM-dependent methyltransferase [Planctomycetota bacterium]
MIDRTCGAHLSSRRAGSPHSAIMPTALLTFCLPFVCTLLAFGSAIFSTETPWSSSFVACVFLVGLSAALVQSCVFAWTGNRIVSVICACLFGLQPWVAGALFANPSISTSAAVLLGLAGMRLHGMGARALREGRDSRTADLLAVAAVGGGGILGHPAVLAMPALWLLADVVFWGTGVTRRAAVYAVGGLGLACWAGAQSALEGPSAASSIVAMVTAQATPVRDFELHTATVAGAVIGMGTLALLAALWRRAAHPRWLLLHSAFGFAWLAVFALVALSSGSLSPLAALGPCFLLPAWAWRALLLTPLGREDLASAAAPPSVNIGPAAVQSVSGNHHASPQCLNVEQAAPLAQDSLPTAAEICTRVDAAVAAAVEASVGSLLTALAQQRSVPRPLSPKQDSEAHVASEAWMRQARAAADQALVAEDVQDNLRQGVFATLLQPFLGTGVRALELAPSRYSGWIAAAAGEYVCVDTSPLALQQARRSAVPPGRGMFVLAEGTCLSALPASSFDFAFAATSFASMDSVSAFRLLLDVQCVLRTGGVAVLGFANLGDALGRRAFVANALDPGAPRNRVLQSMTVETLRLQATEAGLLLDSVHLTVDGPMSYAVLRRNVSVERSVSCG